MFNLNMHAWLVVQPIGGEGIDDGALHVHGDVDTAGAADRGEERLEDPLLRLDVMLGGELARDPSKGGSQTPRAQCV